MGSLYAVVVAAALCGGGETVLLDFSSETCGPCRAMEPIVSRLAARGLPIRKVSVDREPGLASRFGVTGIPCFVMLVEGREVDRVVGATSASRLEQMLARAEPSRSPSGPPIHLASNDGPVDRPIAIPAVRSDTTFSAAPGAAPAAASRDLASLLAAPGNAAWGPASEAPSPLEAALTAATVRLRIEDANGHSCGSGTIIDARQGWALILTCGHLFRESQGKGRIEVDLFGASRAEKIPAELVHYDSESKDLGLLRIRVPGPVRAVRVAPPGYRVAKGARVFSAGCNNGDPPTVRTGHVTALDRFLGPPNIEVSGLPVQGRSGGGLFSADGLLIGVCNAAVPTDNEGLYAALGAIHAELEQAEFSFAYRSEGSPAAAPTAAASPGPPAMPRQMPAPSDLVSLTDLPRPAAPLAPAERDGPPEELRLEERAALEEIARRKAAGAEVIVIIQPLDRAQGRSEIIVLEKVSPGFLQRLLPAAAPAQAIDRPSSPRPGFRVSQASGAGDGPDGPWRPRWLEPGYPGS